MTNNMEKQLIDNKMCSIIATYHDDDTNKDYIIYTDETKDENGKLNVYYGYYHNENDKVVVNHIDNAKDEEIIMEILKEISNQ